MADYRVNLDVFAGPLDLLLYLVRKDEVDIYDISITKITDQYIRHIEMLKSLDIDLAGDFLVMAATLMQIKSAMLLPKAGPEQLDVEDFTDPRAELIRQLLEYKKFKDAANLLNSAADEAKNRFSRPGTIVEKLKPGAEPQIDIEQVGVWDLLEAFDSIMASTGSTVDMSHITDDTPIDLYQIEILHRLQTQGQMSFGQIFESASSRVVMIGLFLALLELIRERLVWVEQSASSTPIHLRALTEEPAEQAVQKAMQASDVGTNNKKPAQTPQQEEPHIAISELSSKSNSSVSANLQQQEQSPVPVVELPPKDKPAVSLEKYEKERTVPVQKHKRPTKN